MYRLSKMLIEVCGLKSNANRSFFQVFIVTCVMLLKTATCEAILSVKEWNRKMKIKHRKRTVLSLWGSLVGLAPQTKLHEPPNWNVKHD